MAASAQDNLDRLIGAALMAGASVEWLAGHIPLAELAGAAAIAGAWAGIARPIAAARMFVTARLARAKPPGSPGKGAFMSSTTTTIPAAVEAAIDTIEGVVAVVAAGRLTGLSTKVQGLIHTFDQEADAKLDAMMKALDADETSNVYVQQALAMLTTIAKATGFALPDEAQVVAHLKAAVDELFESVGDSTPAVKA